MGFFFGLVEKKVFIFHFHGLLWIPKIIRGILHVHLSLCLSFENSHHEQPMLVFLDWD